MLQKFTRILFITLALAGSVEGSVIGSGAPNQSGGSDLNGFLEADNFTLASSVNIVQVTYWTLQGDVTDYAGSTDWSFHQDASGIPGTVVASGNTVATGSATGNTTLGLNEFAYTFTLSVPLTAGNYWLDLHNGPSASQPATSYYWAWSSGTGNSQSQDLSAAPSWETNDAELAFQLTTTDATTTPEPASLALCGGALLAVAAFRRKMTAKV